MTQNQIVWPMDVSDSEFPSGPLTFKPRGFLVAILEDAEDSNRAVAALRDAGFGESELRVYTCQ
jgi:hypothetical protein